ncbi:MAG: type IV pilus twitching motility protein PilT [Acidobacteriota bacterium]|nr:type IV pilus twitching motility protein PilT [Acidobacteriota bacterium]MDE3044298.1 type IV pilus twitching motility protein PilT [Acidobacteriota bacterium]
MANELSLEPWLESLWSRRGSDLLLVGGSAPRVRVSGRLEPIDGAPVLEGSDVHDLAWPLLNDQQRAHFAEYLDVDFAFSWQDRARIRGSIFTQRGETALALRMIPAEIPTMEQLHLPGAADMVVKQPRGFVLVTGPTGSGKSTTLAAIINRINETRPAHILTIEDPVEYVHHHKMSAVSQREVGLDSPTFDRALRSALREDPDVLLVGEMRDLDSIQIALTMAETGHLVFATLHTNDAPQAIDRIIDVFPPERQEQTRVQIASSLNTVIAQRLVPKIGGGMVAAFEVLVATSPVRNLIREGRASQLPNIMFTSSKDGMQTLETDLARLIKEGQITFEDAMDVTGRPKELVRSLEQMGITTPKG